MVALDKSQVQLAVRALLRHVKSTASASELIEDENVISLQIGFKQVPNYHRAPKLIPIPNSLYDKNDVDICLITKDPQADFEELVEKKKLPGRVHVIGVSKLRSDYKPFEAKRQLCAMYDLFMADDRVMPLLPKLLGKKFFETKKKPVKINMKATNLAGEVAKARDSAQLFLGPGICSSVKVGNATHSVDEVVANIMQVAEKVSLHVRKDGVQNMQIKVAASASLPIYNSIPTFADLQPDPTTTLKPLYTKLSKEEKAARKLKKANKGDTLTASDPEKPALPKKAAAGAGAAAPAAIKGAKGAKGAKGGKKAATAKKAAADSKAVVAKSKKRKAGGTAAATAAATPKSKKKKTKTAK